MSDKKRKAGASEMEKPAKKQAPGPSNSKLRVDFVAGSDVARPVIAVTPGVSLPPGLEFQSFEKKSSNGESSLLLHSSSHPTIDFKSVEGDSNADKFFKHYVAVFDPASSTLQVTEAKKLTVRSCVRQRDHEIDSEKDEAQTKSNTNYSSRAALTHAFGTKKSKKAVQATAENRLLARGSDDANNPLSNAIISSMPSPEPVDPVPASARTNKPLPVPDLATNNINEVYPMPSLVFPRPVSSTLEEMPIGHWRDTVAKRGQVMSQSRFIANRVFYLVSALNIDSINPDILLKVQILRYILLLIELYTYLARQPLMKRLAPVPTWPAKTISGNIPHEIVTKLCKQFAPDGTGLGKNQKTLLQSTILALTLHIPPPSLNAGANVLITEPTDIQMDLAMKAEDVRKLYKELGCKVESAKQAELERWGLQKKESKREGHAGAPKARFAKLMLPLDFPTQSSGRPAQHGRR